MPIQIQLDLFPELSRFLSIQIFRIYLYIYTNISRKCFYIFNGYYNCKKHKKTIQQVNFYHPNISGLFFGYIRMAIPWIEIRFYLGSLGQSGLSRFVIRILFTVHGCQNNGGYHNGGQNNGGFNSGQNSNGRCSETVSAQAH